MKEEDKKRISKFLSLVLRHAPEKIGLDIDENGWASIKELMFKSKLKFSLEGLKEVVETNDKKRFTFNDDLTKIRASQGHSIKVNLELKKIKPPEFLYHGTVSKFIVLIKEQGLKKMSRNHVHLSEDRDTAIKVGSRRGQAIILSVRSGEMYRKGIKFYQSKNEVWLTNEVPNEFIEL
jgi:putative RNA 2'-phosphotransferase